MSIRALRQLVEPLPHSIREDVIGYARSVSAAIPEIFRQARVPPETHVADRVVFVAGIRKLYSISTSNYWILDNSIYLAEGVSLGAIRFAGQTMDRRSDFYTALYELVTEFDVLIEELGIREYIEMESYPELARLLSLGR